MTTIEIEGLIVNFSGRITWDSDDEAGSCRIVKDIDWNRNDFTDEDNAIIEKYLADNYSKVEYEIINL